MVRTREFRRSLIARTASLIVALTGLTGCASLQTFPTNPDQPPAVDIRVKQYFGAGSEAGYYKPENAPLRAAIRNEIINNRILIISQYLTLYEGDLRDARTGVGLTSDLLSLVMNGLGATTGSAEVKAALAAAAGGFTSANASLNKEVFETQTIDAINAQLNADFDKGRAGIYLKLKQDDASYPLSVASTDVTTLLRSVAVSNALNEISTQAKANQVSAADAVSNVISGTFSSSSSSVKLDAWLRPGGKIDGGKVAALQAWMDAQPEIKALPQGLPVEAFVRDNNVTGVDLESLRQKALTALVPAG
jgi:hypothetical protein